MCWIAWARTSTSLCGREVPPRRRSYASGYATHRSREKATQQQLCLARRLSKAKCGHCAFFNNVAFYSPGNQRKDRAVDAAARAQDCRLLKQRHRAAAISLPAPDSALLLATGSGALRRDSFEAHLFVENGSCLCRIGRIGSARPNLGFTRQRCARNIRR